MQAPARLSRGLIAVMAVGCGLAAANLYYAQPLLHTIAKSLRTGPGTAGLIVTVSQIGYAVGLALLVPVGDIVARRRLVPVVLGLTAIALGAAALAPGIGVLVPVMSFVGLGSVAAQILVPFAAVLAGPERRGAVVGTVMSGLLMGVLLARTMSGLIAGAAGWRLVYAIAAGLMLALGAVLARALPDDGDRPDLPYGRLLASTVRVFTHDPVLRRRALFGSLAFAGFSILWTTIAFLLAGSPYRYRVSTIGLFGLIGAAGVLCANLAGRLADRGWTRQASAGFASLTVLSWMPLWLGRHSLGWLIVGVLALDVGTTGTHITNQSVMYAGTGADRSRANAAYMTCYFVGGAIGSATASAAYSAGSWPAVCALGVAVAGAGLLCAGLDRWRPAIAPVG